jgi:hypothetical protein
MSTNHTNSSSVFSLTQPATTPTGGIGKSLDETNPNNNNNNNKYLRIVVKERVILCVLVSVIV